MLSKIIFFQQILLFQID